MKAVHDEGIGFVKQVGFKPGGKRETEYIMDKQSGKSEKEEVMGERIMK